VPRQRVRSVVHQTPRALRFVTRSLRLGNSAAGWQRRGTHTVACPRSVHARRGCQPPSRAGQAAPHKRRCPLKERRETRKRRSVCVRGRDAPSWVNADTAGGVFRRGRAGLQSSAAQRAADGIALRARVAFASAAAPAAHVRACAAARLQPPGGRVAVHRARGGDVARRRAAW
jgi:hypothetical protein